ncbi:YopX family protein [Virgibacillus pantothenticus]|uniref:YopX family protein n=1 Tax=Virgibacillus pantothenticus TaxID=1473 RepID=UPI00098527AE|nr:YopX family protein [Virgibacillus pantothenticus]
MREIKLRGYAVEEMVGSQWLYGTGIHVSTFTDEFFKETGIKEEVYLWTDSGWIEVYKRSVGQYTGQKDKNGKEIYEGDVWDGYKFLLVRYNQDYAGFEPFVNDGGCGCCAAGDVGQTAEHGEVIGNKFEHPHLLG